MNTPQRVSLLLFAVAAACGDSPVDDVIGGGAGDSGGSAGSGSSDGPSFTAIYNSTEFQMCKGCHAPNAPGHTDGIESTQDWSSKANALRTIKGNASGLTGNFEGCNGVPLIAAKAEDSLIVAALDEDVRADFMSSSHPDCNGDAISDMTLKLGGPLPGALLTQLKSWIDMGAKDN